MLCLPETDSSSHSIHDFLRWEKASRDSIDVKRCYVDIAGGDLVAGILLSQLIFYYLPSQSSDAPHKLSVFHEGHYWLPKKREDWWNECRVTPKQFDRASALLTTLQLIVVKRFRFHGSPTVHVRACLDVIVERVNSILTKGENPNSPKGKIEINERGKSLRSRDPDLEIKREKKEPPFYPPLGGNSSPQTPSGSASLEKKKTSRAPLSPSPAEQAVLTHLNMVHSRTFSNTSEIHRLLHMGRTVVECLLVIDWCWAIDRVENPDGYERYFNTVTPFRPANFDRLLDRAQRWHRDGRPPWRARTLTRDEQRQAELKAWAEAP